jgi:hypothetical protein
MLERRSHLAAYPYDYVGAVACYQTADLQADQAQRTGGWINLNFRNELTKSTDDGFSPTISGDHAC